MVLAETIPAARDAAVFIEKECIAYEDLLPAVITMADAIKYNTEMPMILKSSNPDEDIHQRIPTIERSGSNQDWLKDQANQCLELQLLTALCEHLRPRTSTWKLIAPSPCLVPTIK